MSNNPGGVSSWKPEYDEALRAHVAAKLSFTEAAGKLNAAFGTAFTRSAVCGRAHRIGLKSRNDQRKAKAHEPRQPKPRQPKPRPRPAPGLRSVDVIPLHLSLIELEPHHCRFPYGDGPFTFCGHPMFAGFSYCESHAALALGDNRGRGERDEAYIARLKRMSRPAVDVLAESGVWLGEDAA